MTLDEAKDLATIFGVVIGVGSIVFAALNVLLNLKTNKAKFWLDLGALFAKHDVTSQKLRSGGEWDCESDPEAGPTKKEDWVEIEKYFGFFEQCESLIAQGLLDSNLFQKTYGRHVDNLFRNHNITRATLVRHPLEWKLFMSLLKRLGYLS